MYPTHWGLQESPFRSCLDPRYFYQSPAHEEALARLHFLVEQRRRVGLLMGPPGSGKSLLLEVFAGQLRRSGRAVAEVSLLGVEPTEMLHLLAASLKLNLDAAAPVVAVWQAIVDRLAEHRFEQRATVILADDADRASQAVISQLTRLARHGASPDALRTIVLTGRREQMGRLGHPLLDLAELRIDVEPWERSDTEDFLRSSLAQAGCRDPVFAGPAVERLHQLGHGIPRRISQLADLALLAGAGAELPQIDADVVESVYRELSVGEVR